MEFSVKSAMEAFWSEDFWLPPNVTWAELDPRTTSTPYVHFCNFRDLGYPLIMCWMLLAFRFTLERSVFRAVGISMGLPDRSKRSKPPKNDVLEEEFLSGRRLTHSDIARYEYSAFSSADGFIT